MASDVYRNFKFKLKWDGKYVAGISKANDLDRTIETVKFREGGTAASSGPTPGQSEYQAITLERGVTHDAAFEQWCNKVWDYHNTKSDAPESLKDFRKDMILDVYNVAGEKVLSYNIYRCWPSEFIALPELDAGKNTVVIESLVLQNEGWERAVSP